MIIAPIYKDTVFTYTGQALTYSIELAGDTIFNGRAYAAPNESTIKVNINRSCENYLNNNAIETVLATSAYTQESSPEAYREFELKDDSGNTLETYGFLYNYDYDGDFEPLGMTLSDPITDAYASPMRTLFTEFNGAFVVNDNGSSHYTRPVCDAQYALYYLNAKGGWDAFVIEGNSIRTDSVDRHQYNKTYNNQTIEYERNTYISEIATSWKLNTGLLDDAQAHKLCWHLLASNRVYLHDLKADRIYPAVITNTQNIYNTYRNNNHQPIQYEINLTESQTKLRQ